MKFQARIFPACLVAAVFLLAYTLTGCREYKDGPTKTESATVTQLAYVPSGHGSGVGYNFGRGGGLTVSSVDIPERYAIVFRCQHGTFVVENHAALWKTLHEGQRVTIYYRERLVRESEADGWSAYDMDFLNAVPE